jgi:S-adenosylmethionine-diacylglycerol 3-amino-3-carboxypropyl transferase
MSAPPLRFAVMREDPEIEASLCARFHPQALLTVASGGCTALTLAARFPDLAVTAFDLNPTQLAHVARKRDAVARGDVGQLNVDDDSAQGLNQCGTFEALFRVLRAAVIELCLPEGDLARIFEASLPAPERAALVAQLTSSSFWPAVFTTAFNDGLLHAMFGVAATQHAAPGSYPPYFQAAFERGLRAAEAARNPFLQHVFLGRYRAADAPDYIRAGRAVPVDLLLGSLPEVPALERFGLYSLSNIFDWSDDALVEEWARLLCERAAPGSVVVMRQLNNQRDLRRFFAPHFVFDEDLGRKLVAQDRSLFYQRIEVGIRR